MDKIEVPISERENLIDYYLKKKEVVLSQLSSIDSMLNSLGFVNKKAATVNNSSNTDIIQFENGYIPQWSWIKKIHFVLNNSDIALTARQITDKILSLEPDSNLEGSKIFATISGQLSNKISAGKDFEREKNVLDEYVYRIKR